MHTAATWMRPSGVQVIPGKIQRGDWGDPQSHLEQAIPQPPLAGFVRLVEFWAAVSGGLLLLVFLALVLIDPLAGCCGRCWSWRSSSAWRRRCAADHTLPAQPERLMAVITTLVLVYEFFFWIVIAAVVGIVIYMIAGNLLAVRALIGE
jgi:hypothetical protein